MTFIDQGDFHHMGLHRVGACSTIFPKPLLVLVLLHIVSESFAIFIEGRLAVLSDIVGVDVDGK